MNARAFSAIMASPAVRVRANTLTFANDLVRSALHFSERESRCPGCRNQYTWAGSLFVHLLDCERFKRWINFEDC